MFLGVDIGGTKCAVVLGDENGNIIEKVRFATGKADETVEKIIETLKVLSKGRNIYSCGVSCGGPLDEKKGIILSPPNLPTWDNIPIKDIIERETGVQCVVRNDANASAVAEYYFGAGKGAENMIFLTFGTGLGAGIILGGKLYSGTNGFAGEAGHIRLSEYGPSGYGKKGSFEGFCSGGGLCEIARTVAMEYSQKGRTPFWAENTEPANVAKAAREGDAAAKEVFRICGEMLGKGLAILVDILNPQRIIIGSVYARCVDLLREPMEKSLKKEALAQSLEVLEVLPAKLGESIGDVAALAVAREAFYELYN